MPNFQRWDLKYYYQIHCQRQKSLGNTPISYSNFVNRVHKMTLYDAIYKPRVERQVRDTNKTPIQDAVRRRQINKEENIQILDFKYMEMVEKRNFQKKTARIQMPKPKKTILQRIISWIKDKN